jgi:hypothetical protein
MEKLLYTVRADPKFSPASQPAQLLKLTHEVSDPPPSRSDGPRQYGVAGAEPQPHPAGAATGRQEAKEHPCEPALRRFDNEVTDCFLATVQTNRQSLQELTSKTRISLQSGWQFGSAEGEHANRGQGRGDLIVAATGEQALFAEHIARSQIVDDRLAPARQPHATRTQEIQGARTVVEIE